MKDKIYIRPSEFDTPWCIDEDINSGGVEYIRKDALIEYLEARKKDIILKTIPGAEDPVMYGKLKMCEEIINKLNDM